MANEPGQAVLTVLDQIIERIKSTRPMRSDNKPLETGFVYSQLVLGQMVDPDDFANPWSPMGGSTVHDALKDGKLPANAGASVATGTPATPAADGSAQGGGADPAVSAKLRRALQAAFNTSQLVDRLIMVTRDETMREYPGGGRTISFAYEGIVNGMQPLPAPPLAPEVQKRLDDARKVLYEFDEDGEIAGKSKLYKTYVKNARAYAEAKSDFADAQAAALQDPVKAESWPMKSVTLQQSVDEAYDTLKTEGAEKVEAALAVIESIGISIQDRMIAKARKIFDAWNLGLSGVPTQTPYSSVLPSGWADPDEDMDGWYHLTVDRSSYANHSGRIRTSSSRAPRTAIRRLRTHRAPRPSLVSARAVAAAVLPRTTIPRARSSPRTALSSRTMRRGCRSSWSTVCATSCGRGSWAISST